MPFSAPWAPYSKLVTTWSANPGRLYFKDTRFNTIAEWKANLALNPLTLYYELATPVEIDISEYLTDDNLIQVDSGGTLTFPNSNGTDYQIPVPSDVTYMIDLQAAINDEEEEP